MQLVLFALLTLQGQQKPDKLKLPSSTTDEQLAEKRKGLDLRSCKKITDAGFIHLKGLRKLEVLDLGRTKITDAGAKKLKESLSECRIYK